MGGSLFYRDAPPTYRQSGQLSAPNAGVAIIIHNPNITGVQLMADPRGMLAVSLRRQGMAPFLLVALYLPPATSTHKAWRRPLLTLTNETIIREQTRHPRYAVAGDLNSQIGPYHGRLTAARTSVNHSELINIILSPRAMSPVSGRHCTAALTSPRIAVPGNTHAPMAEVDYILTRSDTPALALPTIDAPGVASWHRPIGASIDMIPLDPTYNPQPVKRARAPHPPPHASPFWTTGFANMSAALGRVERAATAGAPPAVLYELLTQMYTINNNYQTAVPQLTHIRRSYQGATIPPDAIALLASARSLRNRKRKSRDEDERNALAEEAAALQSTAATVTRAARNLAKAAYLATLEEARRSDSRGLLRAITATASGTSSSTGTRPPEAAAAFRDHYRGLLSAADPRPPTLGIFPILPPHVPRSWARINWVEIYLVLFPYSQRIFDEFEAMGGRTPQCTPTCTICAEFRAHGTARGLDPSNVMPPKWTPTIRLSRAPGLDEVTAEMLRHFRSPASHDDTWSYQARLAKLLARLFDALVDEGPPAGLVDVALSALAKVSKNGIHPDPSLPDKTRGISLHNTLAKLHDIIIDVRFTHTIVTERIVSTAQAGFMPHRSAEQAAFVLMETIRGRLRENLPTWVLFVDFWKAYDSVSPSVLWTLLTNIGFPPRIIAYLQTCYERRKTYFTFNNETTSILEQLIGLCQGGVLSCLLFNLFIEPLSQFLKQSHKFTGATVTSPGGTFNLLHVLFADDLAVCAETRGELAALAEAITTWCTAHGLKATVSGLDKTVAMLCQRDPPETLPPPLTIRYRGLDRSRDLHIPFSHDYIYIGHHIRDDLDPVVLQNSITTKMRDSVAAFINVTALKTASLALQRSYLTSIVVGAASNLLAMAPPGVDFEAKINTILLTAAAHILHTSTDGLRLTGLVDLRILPAGAMIVRAYERFRLSTLIHGGPAADLLRVIHSDAIVPTGTRAQRISPLRSWTASYYNLLRRSGFSPTWTMELSATQCTPWSIHSLAAALAARAAYSTWTRMVVTYVNKRTNMQVVNPLAPGEPPTLYAINASSMTAFIPDGQAPAPRTYRPTAYGPNMGAPPYSHTRLGPAVFTTLHCIRTGRQALFRKPFWPPPPKITPIRVALPPGTPRNVRRNARIEAATAAAVAKEAYANASATRAAAIHRYTRCNLCDNARGDLVHLCTVCPATASRRDATYGNGNLTAMLTSIAEALYAAHGRPRAPAALLYSISNLATDAPETLFMVTNIINSAPWRPLPMDASWTVARRLGELFDRDIPLRYAPMLSHAWCTAAHKIATSIGLRWWTLLPATARAALEAAGHHIPR